MPARLSAKIAYAMPALLCQFLNFLAARIDVDLDNLYLGREDFHITRLLLLDQVYRCDVFSFMMAAMEQDLLKYAVNLSSTRTSVT